MRLTLSAFAPRLRSGIIPFGPNLTRLGRLPLRSKFAHKGLTLLSLASLVATILLPLLGFILPSSPVQAASWWNEDYRYRQQIDITSATNQNNTYITLTLDTSDTTRFKNDCSDLRFIDFNNQTIPYYIASGCGTASTQVQLLFPSLAATTTSLYLYYANPSASPVSVTQPFNNPASGTTSTKQAEETSQAPIAMWKLDEGYGTTANSSATTNFTGTLSNGPAWQNEDTCVSGKCLYFDGVDDRVDVPTDVRLNNGSDNFSISVWVKTTSTDRVRIINKWDNPSSTGWLLDLNGNNSIVRPGAIRFRIGNAATNTEILTNDVSINDGRWHHIAVTVARGVNDGLSIYKDGQLIQRSSNFTSVVGSISSSATFGMGVIPSTASIFYKGFIDEPKLYSYARTQAQVQQDYLAGKQQMAAQQSNLSDGLVGYWKMDEYSWNGTAGEVKDASGAANNGVANESSSTAAAKFGSGANVSGSTHVSVGYNANLQMNGSFTASIWVKPTDITAHRAIFKGAGATGYQSGWRVYIDSTNQRAYVNVATSASTGGDASTGSVSLNEWQQVVAVYDMQTLKIYLNGQLQGTTAITGPLYFTDTSSMQIGYSSGVPHFVGGMDEARLYNRPLTSTEVSQLYTYAPRPIAYFDFEQSTVSTLYDKSGNGLNGSWAGSAAANTAGKLGKAATFDGLTNAATITGGNDSALDGERGFTWSIWLKRQGNSTSQWPIIMGQVDSHARYAIRSQNYGNQITFEYGRNAYDGSDYGIIFCDANNLPVDQWRNFTATYNGTTLKFYTDGKQCGADITVTLNPSFNNIFLSQSSYGRFAGQVDEVKVYNYARTQSQISQDIQLANPTKPAPMAYWKFDENQGLTAEDSSGLGNTGTLTCVDTGCILPSWQSGKVNAALKFDASTTANNAMVTVPANQLLSTNEFTLSAWVNPSSSYSDTSGTILRNGNSANTMYRLGYNPDAGRVFVQWYDGTGSSQAYGSDNSVPLDKWTYITVVRQGTKISFYSNGQLTRTATGSLPSSTTGGPITIGRTPEIAGTQDYSGLIDEVKIYTTPLTAQQIAIDYNQAAATIVSAPGTEPTLSASSQNTTKPSSSQDAKYCVPGDTSYCTKPIAEYTFEETSTGVVLDRSGNNNNATWAGTGNHYGSGKNGKAGQFDKSKSDRAEISDSPSLNIATNKVTISAWVKPASVANGTNYNIFAKDDWVNKQGYRLLLSGTGGGQNRPLLVVGTGGINCSTSSGVDLTDTTRWYHVSASFTNGSYAYYVDGKLVATPTCAATTMVNTSSGATIGRNASGTENYDGLVDDIRVYNYARTPAQVAWDYNNGAPIARYKFDECSGAAIHDSANSSLSAILNLGVSGVTEAGNCNTSNSAWGLGKLGNQNAAVSLDGIDDYIDVANPAIPASDVTISLWINPVITGTEQRLYAFGPTTGCNPSSQILSIIGSIVFFRTGCGATTQSSNGLLSSGKWSHVMATISKDGLVSLYVNGKLVNTPVNIRSGQSVTAGNNLIGTGYSGGSRINFYQGLIDDVQIFNYVLTQKQIDALYNGGSIRWGQ